MKIGNKQLSDGLTRLTLAELRGLQEPRANKYGAKATVVDGIRFDSKLEAERWQQLVLLQQLKSISNLERQVRFPLEVNGVLIATYVADFVYLEDGEQVVEDSKGKRTREYQMKAKLMRAVHGIEIRETGAEKRLAKGSRKPRKRRGRGTC